MEIVMVCLILLVILVIIESFVIWDLKSSVNYLFDCRKADIEMSRQIGREYLEIMKELKKDDETNG